MILKKKGRSTSSIKLWMRNKFRSPCFLTCPTNPRFLFKKWANHAHRGSSQRSVWQGEGSGGVGVICVHVGERFLAASSLNSPRVCVYRWTWSIISKRVHHAIYSCLKYPQIIVTEFLSVQLFISGFTESLECECLDVCVLLQEHWTRPTLEQHTCVIRQENSVLTAVHTVLKKIQWCYTASTGSVLLLFLWLIQYFLIDVCKLLYASLWHHH